MKTSGVISVAFCLVSTCAGFSPRHLTAPSTSTSSRTSSLSLGESSSDNDRYIQRSNDNNSKINNGSSSSSSRREALQRAVNFATMSATATASLLSLPTASHAAVSGAADSSNKYAPEFVQTYSDFVKTEEGWQYKDVKIGKGDGANNVSLEVGDRAVFDWSGYTIGYFGRPFEAKGGPQGGAFDKDLDYSRTVIGSGKLVPGLEKALMDMKPGGVRQVIVPYGPLSYPPEDLEHKIVGPAPTTFSGQRALNFVLENPRVDRTLLFNVKLIRVDKANGKGGFIRG